MVAHYSSSTRYIHTGRGDALQRHNLPAPLTSFVGRDRELREVERLISERRLVSLTGVGGCGKTRLALRAGADLVGRWPDGVWFVDLGSVTDPALVPRLVASTLRVLVEPGGDQVAVLAAQLRGRQMLLLLDTCEHLLDAAAALTEALLRGCPGVSVLTTTREPLGVEGETIWRVPSLNEEEAFRLFADRAGLVAPGFDVHTARGEVAAVCARVDRIPLAVELAAAWVRALTPAQIALGLEDSFRLLMGGPRKAIARHQTLLASMAWSHALLADDEKVLLRRLSVFAGTFTLDAAARVCVDEPSASEPDPDTLRLMGRLLDKSLVTVRETAGEARYRLLDTIRQYADEQLRAAGEVEKVRDRHLDYFLALAENAERGLDRDQDTWRVVLESHHDNINAALQWGLSAASDRGNRGRRLAAAMAMQWFIRGQSAEGLDFLNRAIGLAPEDRSAVQGRLLAGTAMLGMVTGRMDLVTETAAQGLEIAAEVGDDKVRSRCLGMAAWPQFFLDFDRCQALNAEARAVAEAAGDPFSRDWAHVMEAYSLTTRDRHDEAVALARAALERSRSRGDRFCAGFARGVEAWAALETGRLREALDIAQDTMEIVTPLGDYFAVGTLETNLALVTGLTGDVAAGRKMMDSLVLSMSAATGEVDAVGFMVVAGLLALWAGDLEAALGWFDKGVQRMTANSKDWTACRCLPGRTEALRRLGRVDEAQESAARALALAREYGAPYLVADALDELGHLARAANPARARDLHHEALAVRHQHGLRTFLVRSLDSLASLDADAGNKPEAVRLLATCDAAREDMGYPRPPVELPEHEATLATVRAGLGDEEFATFWAEGSARTLDDTISAVTRGRGPRGRPGLGWESLTPTQLDVVRLVSEGLSNPEIADRLYISRSTVKTHLSQIYARLGVGNRTELATLASTQPNP